MSDALWNREILSALRDAKEVDITPVDAAGAAHATRTIWSIGVGGELYVRSWKGRGAVWFRGIVETGEGTVAVTGGGASQNVRIEEVDVAASVQEQISATFLTKYADDGYAAAMNGPTPLEATLKLIPR